ncbi:hypothetical protein CIPAW_07G084100 [Carya illinoinensis]|uniref:Uncharacterized protein n=1 Tax=Carya illinoinensis TaxID=32201 RepID=A0A8T1Q0Z7_CARIL|nr:hypothetical protein CIPAW_07G084100 [Carya illinoinensis]
MPQLLSQRLSRNRWHWFGSRGLIPHISVVSLFQCNAESLSSSKNDGALSLGERISADFKVQKMWCLKMMKI